MLPFLVTACAVGKDYQKLPPDLGPVWNAFEGVGSGPVVLQNGDKEIAAVPWWQRFGDPVLSELVEKALANNNDLKLAEARIREAEANKRGTAAGLLPQVDATGSVSRHTVNVPSGRATDTLSQGGVQGSWEIDLFGGNRRRDEAAAANVEAAQAERDLTRLAVLAEVARNYVRLRSSQRQYAITLKNLKLQQNTLEVTRAQRREGDVTELEVVRAKAQADATAARLPQIKTAIFAAISRLSVLTGEKLDALRPGLSNEAPIPKIAAQQVLGTPIEVIAGRPDARAAERRLAEATALSGEAFAQLFPKLTLEGFFAAQRSALYAPVSPWSAALKGLFPLLDFGRLRAQVDAADARQEQAFFRYQQTVLLAVEETENALTTFLNEGERVKTLASVAAEQARAAEIAREQYKAGLATQLDLLVAQNNQLDAENALVGAEASVSESLILLFRALGEGK